MFVRARSYSFFFCSSRRTGISNARVVERERPNDVAAKQRKPQSGRKSIDTWTQNDQNVLKNDPERWKIDQKSVREPLGRSWAIREPPGTLLGRLRTPSGASRDVPGAPRDDPGTLPGRIGATQKCVQELSPYIFWTFLVERRSRHALGAIFG